MKCVSSTKVICVSATNVSLFSISLSQLCATIAAFAKASLMKIKAYMYLSFHPFPPSFLSVILPSFKEGVFLPITFFKSKNNGKWKIKRKKKLSQIHFKNNIKKKKRRRLKEEIPTDFRRSNFSIFPKNIYFNSFLHWTIFSNVSFLTSKTAKVDHIQQRK